MLARVDQATLDVEARGSNVCVGSGDVVALYPSLLHEQSAKLCRDLILQCPATFSNINTRAASIFVATNCTVVEIREAGLTSLIPTRVYRRGHHPTRSTKELTSRSKVPPKFTATKDFLTETETKCLVAKVVEVGVRMVVRNHLYQWKGQTWRQNVGVPTGLRLSGVIGRITMDVWLGLVRDLMNENMMVTYMIEKYVDDVNQILENLPMGTRWDSSTRKMVTTEEAADDDRKAGYLRIEKYSFEIQNFTYHPSQYPQNIYWEVIFFLGICVLSST